MEDAKKKVGIGLGAGSLLGVLYGLNPASFVEIMSASLAHEYMRIAAMFTIIAFFHRQGMRKDSMKLTDAINNLGEALRADLGKMGNEIVLVKESVFQIKSRVDTLEKLKE